MVSGDIVGGIVVGIVEWLFGRSHRMAIYVPDGTRYEGEFINGRLHGQGVMTWADGTVIKGEWRHGKRVEN